MVLWGFRSPEVYRQFLCVSTTQRDDQWVLRQPAIRLNSSTQCSIVRPKTFPSPYPGAAPFEASYVRNSYLSIDICAPGNLSAVPWTISRDRQDIEEHIFINVTIFPHDVLLDTPIAPFTMLCTANSTQNGCEPGPLLMSWPSKTDLATNFNDYLGFTGHYEIPSTT